MKIPFISAILKRIRNAAKARHAKPHAYVQEIPNLQKYEDKIQGRRLNDIESFFAQFDEPIILLPSNMTFLPTFEYKPLKRKHDDNIAAILEAYTYIITVEPEWKRIRKNSKAQNEKEGV